jgi:hypothetical protein
MSADNWAICPRCLRREEARLSDLQRRTAEAYGVLPVAEFDAMRAEANRPIDTAKLTTFREDYEIYGAEEGHVVVSYSGSCSTCKLNHKIHTDEQIPGWTNA